VEAGVEVRIGSQGRIVLPKALRERIGAEEGAVYQASVEDGRLILETRAALLRRMQAEIGDAINGKRSLTDELIAERRAAARREAEA
jgi:AbrB family looped-hinge helix DNA binding protein